MSTWIVLPTYNEASTLPALYEHLRRVTDANLLVVDDGSPDGTGDLAERLAIRDTSVHVLHRSGKLGLGSAYRDGFRYALERGATTVVQMDADGSHDPDLLPRLLKTLEAADVVLASRYVPGGSFPIAWYRRIISTAGNIYIRALLGWRVRDWSTGYKVWRSEFLQRVMDCRMEGHGYAWLMEMTWLAKRLGGRVVEVPLVFRERQGGDSKFSWQIAAEDITLAWKLWRRRTLA